MWKQLLNFLAGGTVEQVGAYFKERQKLKHAIKIEQLKGKQAVLHAKYQAQAEREKNAHTWEMAQIQNSGWKDEVVLFVVLLPYIGSYIPGVQDYVYVGHQYLAQYPAWAIGLTVTIFLAIYGIRHRNATKINAPGLRKKDVTNDEEPKS